MLAVQWHISNDTLIMDDDIATVMTGLAVVMTGTLVSIIKSIFFGIFFLTTRLGNKNVATYKQITGIGPMNEPCIYQLL
jgi:hypothetical protein